VFNLGTLLGTQEVLKCKNPCGYKGFVKYGGEAGSLDLRLQLLLCGVVTHLSAYALHAVVPMSIIVTLTAISLPFWCLGYDLATICGGSPLVLPASLRYDHPARLIYPSVRLPFGTMSRHCSSPPERRLSTLDLSPSSGESQKSLPFVQSRIRRMAPSLRASSQRLGLR
jgi:hypothetical protein